MALTAEDMIWQMRRDPRNVPNARDLPQGIFVDPSVKDIWGRGYGGGLMSRTPFADWSSVGAPRTVAPQVNQWQTANPTSVPILVRDPADIGAALSPWIGRNDQVEVGNIGRANAAEQLSNNWDMARLQMRREDAANAERRAAAAEAQNIADQRWALEQKDRKAYEDKYFKEREEDRIARYRESMTNEGLKAEADMLKRRAQAEADAKTAQAKTDAAQATFNRLVDAGIAQYEANPKNKPLATLEPDVYRKVLDGIVAAARAKAGVDSNVTFEFKKDTGQTTRYGGSLGNKWYETPSRPGAQPQSQPWPAPNTTATGATTTSRPTLEQFNAAAQKAFERAVREGKDIRAVKREIANRAKAYGFMAPKDWE